MPPSIYSYIKGEESKFETTAIRVGHNWMWNFRNHVQMIFHLKNGMFFTGENNWLRAFKNIMEPILNLAYWTEDIEVKDVVFYIENTTGRVLSFFIKKYHDEVYVKENDLDTFFDEVTESDIDYGGALVQETNSPRPEVKSLVKIAFCNQANILGSPIAFKESFSPGGLRAMSKLGWGKKENGATISIEELIVLAEATTEPAGLNNPQKDQTTGKVIDVYIVKGCFPQHYMKDDDNMENFYDQLQIRAFYTDKDGKQEGVCLYRKPEDEGTLFFHTSKKVENRALGRGTGEAILPDQIWTNFAEIHKMKMLEAGAKSPIWTDDENFQNVNAIQDQDNLTINKLAQGARMGLVPTIDVNKVQLFTQSIDSWYQHAQLQGAAFDPIMGQQPVSGTTFRGQERIVHQGRGSHDRRKGQRAKFFEKVYRKIVIPKMVKSILNGKEFLATLSAEEMGWVSQQLAENHASRMEVDMVLAGKLPAEGVTFAQLKELNKQKFLTNFSKKGNKHLLEILAAEFKDVEIKIGINIANKQKDLAAMSEKVLSIFQFIFQNPTGFMQAMKVPALAKSFSDILEFSGMSMTDFNTLINAPIPQATPESQSAPTGSPQELAMAETANV